MIDNNLWKFDKNLMLNFISGEWPYSGSTGFFKMTPSWLWMAYTSPEKLGRTSHSINLLGIGEMFQNCRFDQHRCYHSNAVMTSCILHISYVLEI